MKLGERVAIGLGLAAVTAVALPAAAEAPRAEGIDAATCSIESRACVIAIASTHLDALEGSIPPDEALLHDEVAQHTLGDPAEHARGNADAVRATYAASPDAAITGRDWVVDGAVAFVDYAVEADDTVQHRATRITLRDGRIWAILDTPLAEPSVSGGGGTAPAGVAAVAGPTAAAVELAQHEPDNANWCTTWLAQRGDASLAAADHERCMIAIASSYVDAEENSAPNTQVLFDPRVSKHSLGAPPNHQAGNGDEIRTEIGVITRVIRSIDNRQWTVDGNTVWIVYDGYLVASATEPGFYVAEKFTIRDGLIWELMIAPVVVAAVPEAPT